MFNQLKNAAEVRTLWPRQQSLRNAASARRVKLFPLFNGIVIPYAACLCWVKRHIRCRNPSGWDHAYFVADGVCRCMEISSTRCRLGVYMLRCTLFRI